MTTPTFQLLAALLSLATIAGVALIVVTAVASRRSPAARELGAVIAGQRSLITASLTTVATAGSLYFSEVAHYVPCTLCWYQRIAMYSLAAISITATVRRETPTAYFVLLAGLGAPISMYHWLLERFPDLDTGACSSTVPCTLVWFEKFGFVTLPFMALTAFAGVLAINLLVREDPR
jgi:disulfide bond formation protein DsbB